MISFTTMETPVGTLIPYVRITPSDDQLIAILWNNEPRRRELLSAAPSMHPTAGLLGLVIDQLRAYFLGEMQEFTVPLAPAGTEFQRAAWMALRKIPYGQTSTYASQAERIGQDAGDRVPTRPPRGSTRRRGKLKPYTNDEGTSSYTLLFDRSWCVTWPSEPALPQCPTL